MLLQKYILVILLEAVLDSFAFSGISGRIKITAIFKKRNENEKPKEQTTLNQETQSPPVNGDIQSPSNVERSQSSYGTSTRGETSGEDTFYSAEDNAPASSKDIEGSQDLAGKQKKQTQYGEEGSIVGPLIPEGINKPYYDPLAGIMIISGQPSTVEMIGGGTSSLDTQSVQPFDEWDGGSGSSVKGAQTNQQIPKEQGMLVGWVVLGSDQNSGISYSPSLQSGTYPAETQPYYSGMSTVGTQSVGTTGEENPVYENPVVVKGDAAQKGLSGESLDFGKLSPTESQSSNNMIGSGAASVLGASTEERKPFDVITADAGSMSDKGNTRIKIGRRKKGRSNSGGVQGESIPHEKGLDKKTNEGGKEKEGPNDMPDGGGGGEEKGQHKEADEGEVIMHLESSRDTEYFGQIMLGSAEDGQEQWFTVVIDTGSADLWVPKSGTCVPDILEDCSKFRGFDGSRSCTFKPIEKSFILTYGDGTQVKGKLGTDIMKLGSGKTQIVVPEMLFGLGEFRGNFHSKADGILGLGFKYGSAFPGKPTTPFQEMISQAKILPQFGIFLNRKIDGENMGELVLGGHDEDLVEDEFTFLDVQTSYFAYRYWLFKLDGISVGDQPIPYDTNIRALADSGATLIIVPRALADLINTAIWGSDKANWKQFFDCNTVNTDQLPKITFKIKDKPFVLTPEEYISKIPEELSSEEAKYFSNEEQRCLFGIREDAVPNQIILGQVFMRVYYTKFDWEKKQIGFARAKHCSA